MNIFQRAVIGIKQIFGGFGVSVGDRNARRHYSYWRRNSIYLDNIYNKIATDVAMLRFKHVKIKREQDAPDKMTWEMESPISQVLNISPNDYETPIVFWSNVVRKMLQDQFAIVVPTYRKGDIESLHLVDGVIYVDDHKVSFEFEGKAKTLDINSVWIFENPKQNISAQLGDISKLIDDNLRALSYKISEQGNWLKGLLKSPTVVRDEMLKSAAEKRINSIMETAKTGGIAVLEKGEEFQELNNKYSTASPEEMEFLKLQLYQGFGINEKLFTCDYTESQYRAYFSSVLKVYQRVISEEINRKYFSKTSRTQGHQILVYFDMFDITSLKDLNEFAFKTKYSGIFNANEIREIFGYGAYQGGDTYETNKNALPIDDIANEVSKSLLMKINEINNKEVQE